MIFLENSRNYKTLVRILEDRESWVLDLSQNKQKNLMRVLTHIGNRKRIQFVLQQFFKQNPGFDLS
jgi:hypothetical protein